MPYAPTKSMQAAARAAKAARDSKPKSQRGMTATGLRRMSDLIAGREFSLNTVKRMLGYLSRHLPDKQGETWGEQGKGWQAWNGWGGDSTGAWAARIIRRDDPAWWNRWVEGPRNKALAYALGFSAKPVTTDE